MTDRDPFERPRQLVDALADALDQEREDNKPYTGDGVIDVEQRDMAMLTCPFLNGVGKCLNNCRETPVCTGEDWTPRDAQGRYLGNEITRDQLKAIATERWRTREEDRREREAEWLRRLLKEADLKMTVRRHLPGDTTPTKEDETP